MSDVQNMHFTAPTDLFKDLFLLYEVIKTQDRDLNYWSLKVEKLENLPWSKTSDICNFPGVQSTTYVPIMCLV